MNQQLLIPSALIRRLRTAQHIAVLTGAGISAESNIPTFREAQTGLWAQYDPQELATPEAFQRNPRLVWEWYAWRQELVTRAQPNPGHHALVAMQSHCPAFTLITQNVDGLHQRAGSTAVLELHGNLFRVKCFENNHVVTTWEDSDVLPPRCPHCAGQLRPDVVWFGEMLPAATLEMAQQAASSAEVFFTIGTSSLVYPAAELPLLALRAGAIVVEINPQPTPISQQVSFSLQAPAALILPQLLAATWSNAE